MAIQSDRWIREQAQGGAMIEPFVEAQRRDGCISYGLSSYGYDATPDGSRFLFSAATGDEFPQPPPITVALRRFAAMEQ